jgi:hypothetical protein
MHPLTKIRKSTARNRFFLGLQLFQLFTSIAKSSDPSTNLYSLKTLSTHSIPFSLTSVQKQNLVKPASEFFIEEDGILQIIPTTDLSCLQCGNSTF